MQITETKNEGLKREYAVQLDAKSVSDQMDVQLKSLGKRVRIAGFRPGHVPISVLKQRYGKDVMGDVIERAVNESSQRLMRERNLRPAMQPKMEITSYKEGGDLHFRMEIEVMPEVPQINFDKIALEKMVCAPETSEVDEAITRLSERNKTFVRAEAGTKAKQGDQLLIDFVGRVDGEAFEGGAAKKFSLTLGSNQFIPGFEDQLEGVKEGDEKVVKVSFPESYHKDDLAGKPAEFAVTVHEVRKGEKTAVDNDFAKKFGFSDVAAMRKAIEEQFTSDYEAAARTRMKKRLFDELEKDYDFTLPQGMVDTEFASIWEKLQEAKKEGDEAIASKSDDELRTEYGKIANRRVKLGILLSEVAARHKLQVSQDELARAMRQQAAQFPGQEQRIFEFYQKHPHHLEDLRGPILEEKAVDFIIGKAKVTERKVTREELERDEDEAATAETQKKPKAKKKAANE